LSNNEFKGCKLCSHVVFAVVVLNKFVPGFNTVLSCMWALRYLLSGIDIWVADLIAPYNLLESVQNWFGVISSGIWAAFFAAVNESYVLDNE